MKFSSDQPTTLARKASWCSVINTHPTAGWFDVFSEAARTVLACFAVAAVLVALQCLGGLP